MDPRYDASPADDKPLTSMSAGAGRSRATVWALGLSLLAAAVLGAIAQVRVLDASERWSALGAVAPSTWRARPDGQQGLLMWATLPIPARASVRVRACLAGAQQPELLLDLVDARTHRSLARERLTVTRSLARRCFDAEWRGDGARTVTASLVSKGAPPSMTSLDLRAGATIRALDLWPSLAVVLALALLIFAPRISPRAGDETPETLPSPESLPHAARGAFGLALAVGALVSANVLAQLPVLRGGVRGATLLASLGLQQTLLALASAALLGAFVAPSMRVAIELTAPPRRWAPAAVASALGLLAVAAAVGLVLKDAGDSPIARAVEAMPVRYVIAFGAVCAPLPEELFFRALLGRLVASVGLTRAVWGIALPAALFTLMHAMQLEHARLGLIPIASLGLVNGWLRWKNRGIAVPWAVHTLYNGALALSALA